MYLDIAKAFKAPWNKDGGAARMFLGGLVSLIPILNFVTCGYLIEYLNRFINKDENLGNIFQHGGKSFVTGFKYFVGLILLAIPFIIMEIVFYLIFSKSSSFLYNMLANILSLLYSIIFLLMTINFAKSNKILSMVDFQEAYNLINSKDKLINFAILFLMTTVTQIVYAIPICIIAFIVGLISALFIKSAMLVVILLIIIAFIAVLMLAFAMAVTMFNMIGQFARNSISNLN